MWQPLRLLNVTMKPNYQSFPFYKVKLYTFSNFLAGLEPSSLTLNRCTHTFHTNGNGIPIIQLEAEPAGQANIVTVSTSSYSLIRDSIVDSYLIKDISPQEADKTKVYFTGTSFVNNHAKSKN